MPPAASSSVRPLTKGPPGGIASPLPVPDSQRHPCGSACGHRTATTPTPTGRRTLRPTSKTRRPPGHHHHPAPPGRRLASRTWRHHLQQRGVMPAAAPSRDTLCRQPAALPTAIGRAEGFAMPHRLPHPQCDSSLRVRRGASLRPCRYPIAGPLPHLAATPCAGNPPLS